MTPTAPTPGTALVVVDMQNAFINPSSGPALAGADQVVDAVNGWVAYAVQHDWPIFYTRDIGPTELPPGDPDRQTQLYPGLEVRGKVVDKGPGKTGGFSGFLLAPTGHPERQGPGAGGLSDLAGALRAADVRRLVVVGLAADVCVAATARDARRLGYQVNIALDATAFVHAHPGGNHAALADLAAAGVTIENSSRQVGEQ